MAISEPEKQLFRYGLARRRITFQSRRWLVTENALFELVGGEKCWHATGQVWLYRDIPEHDRVRLLAACAQQGGPPREEETRRVFDDKGRPLAYQNERSEEISAGCDPGGQITKKLSGDDSGGF